MKKKILIIGFGSIGERHYNLLSKLGTEIYILSKRKLKIPCFNNIKLAIKLNKYDYIIIANKTNEHLSTLRYLLNNKIRSNILVEKPLFSQKNYFIKNLHSKIFVGYNLRFSSLFQSLKKILMKKKIYSADFYAGQDLRTWRKNINYVNSYSANEYDGGGVIRDLSHEIDLCLILCGSIKKVYGITEKVSDLDISSDDVSLMVCKHNAGALSTIRLDYLNYKPTRVITLNTNKGTIIADFGNNYIKINNKIKLFQNDHIEKSYLKMHKSILSGKLSELCNFKNANDVLKIINKIKKK